MPTKETDFSSCANVRTSERGISELESGRRVKFVAREEIDSVVLRHGCAAHRPMVELIIGGVLFLAGLFGVYNMVIHDVISLRNSMMFPFLGLIGAVMLFDVMKRRYFLEVVSKKKVTRIVFAKDVDAARAREFCAELERRWQYVVRISA